MKDIFVEIKEGGKLYIDRILFESYYPILFSCKNKIGEHYICVCCQNNKDGKKWLLGKTDVNNIIKILKNEITIRDLLLNYTSSKISVDNINGEQKIRYNNDDWRTDSIYLPKEDSYLEPEEGEFDEEIEYYSQELISRQYDSKPLNNIIQKKVENDGIKLEIDTFEFYFANSIDIVSKVFENYRGIADITITNVESKKLEYEYNKKIDNDLKPYELDISDKVQITISDDNFVIAA
ncbi:hypothetical protein E4O00_11635 [Treponema sp. OMZ 788]|uniref:hypothetical protein n=1 Tax=Treponema sp. OMZ 788 TaxID=2563664 RepID=UPI0020A381CF|nr:hypothetical protein [Treponema sp. OMZ 788]UTC64427.1 hypothetical protein E4O00_11635 [Treponema sp. OMZ 788]